MSTKQFKTEIGGKELLVEIGKLAKQANGSVTVKYGDTVVLVTCVMSDKSREGVNYLPLMVDYEEKLYAAGKIKGSRFIKREGRASDEAIINGRLIDRVIRPLFNSKIRNEIQVVVTVLSFDKENDPVIPSLVGTSIALSISNIPWNGPIGGVFTEDSSLALVIAGDNEKINMIEGDAKESPEKAILETLERASKNIKKLIDFQKDIIKVLQPKKLEIEFNKIDSKFAKEIEGFIGDKLEKALFGAQKDKREVEVSKLKEGLDEFIGEKYEFDETKIQEARDFFEEAINEIVHRNILKSDKRVDGRKLDEVREISCEVGLLPRTHGSGLFTRGETQALSVVTLAPPGFEQLLDEMEREGEKRFIHHYNFPAFSVGEIGPMRGPGRRDIGHGYLAEKALSSIIPSQEDFPYMIRIVSEILSSNGSSSMASICGSTLALLDAGIPIKSNVAGIAMGLILSSDGKKYKILTDIQGPEDHYGDMDLKVAGTKNGVTALQMDVKIDGVSLEILEKALSQAKKARESILKKMEVVIKKHRPDLSPFAPRVATLKINPSKIGEIIGPGGKVINKLTEETGATIDIEDDGTIFVASEKADNLEKAVSRIKEIAREIAAGEVFQGKVVKITDFGAFVQLTPGQDGLLHISELASRDKKIRDIKDIIKEGDIITVRVKNIDDRGKISLSLFKKNTVM